MHVLLSPCFSVFVSLSVLKSSYVSTVTHKYELQMASVVCSTKGYSCLLVYTDYFSVLTLPMKSSPLEGHSKGKKMPLD